jgi:hypothetical protein
MENMNTGRSEWKYSSLPRTSGHQVMVHPLVASIILAILLVLCAAGCSDDNDCNGPGDTESPRVLSTFPAEGDTNIAPDTVVTVTFNERMISSTISAGAFTLEGPRGGVVATVSFDGLKATLTPYVQLAGHSVYTARIDAGVSDLAGNRMGVPYAWSFTTGVTFLQLHPDIEFTVRDIGPDGTPDELVGGGPPGRLLRAGETSERADRAVMEFPLGDIVHDEVLQAIILFNFSENSPVLATVHLEGWGFSGDGLGELVDWSGGHLIREFDSLEIGAGMTMALTMTETINAALSAGATHVGFRLVVTGESQVEISTTNGPSAYPGAVIILEY